MRLGLVLHEGDVGILLVSPQDKVRSTPSFTPIAVRR